MVDLEWANHQLQTAVVTVSERHTFLTVVPFLSKGIKPLYLWGNPLQFT